MLQHVSIIHSFLWMNSIPLYGYAHFFIVHSLIDGHLVISLFTYYE